MQILIISGFLGSGKTSILLPFVKRLSSKDRRVAIIENEIGETGVDDLVLKENGLYVKEIYDGCICCSLRTSLVGALIELARDYKPDVVVMEPTGVADPEMVLATLAGYPGYVESQIMVAVVDAERFEAIENLNIHLAADGIRLADLVALNKIDLISPEKREELEKAIKQINADSAVRCVSIHDEILQNDLFELIESRLFSVQDDEQKLRLAIEKKGLQPSVSSRSFGFTEDEISLSELETKKYFEDKVYRIALRLKEAGADLIGNLKLIIKSDEGGYLLISTTSFLRPPEITGSLPEGYSNISFTMNAMIYGIEKEELDAILNQVLPY